MNKEEVKAQEIISQESFIIHRGVKFPRTQAKEINESVIMDYKFKIGPYGSVSIVESGKRDFQAEVNQFKDKCGINFVVALATKRGILPSDKPFAFNPDNVADIVGFPETQEEAKRLTENTKKNVDYLGNFAKKYGLSTEDLVNKYKDGSLNDYLSNFVKKEVKE